MKTYKFSIITLAILSTLLTVSCTDDSLVDDVRPTHYPETTHQQAVPFDYTVDLSADLRLDVESSKCGESNNRQSANSDQVSFESGCIQKMSIHGVSQGHDADLGRYIISTKLEAEAQTNRVEGTVSIDFPAIGSSIVLQASGRVQMSGALYARDGATYLIELRSVESTGVLRSNDFEGYVQIDGLNTDNTYPSYNAQLEVSEVETNF